MKRKLKPGDLIKRINSNLYFDLDEIGIVISVYKTDMWRYSYLALINNRVQQIVLSRHSRYKIKILQNVCK